MGFFQPAVTPLPAGIDLSGKTAVVTGATSGLGLEMSRQLLTLKISTLILAVRNITKGEAVKASFQSDPDIKAANPKVTIEVMKLDVENYTSPQEFAKAFTSKFQDLHILFLNAGVGTLVREFTSTGHEKNMQINYLSNVLLTLALLPTLEKTAERTGAPTRLTWTGSRMYAMSSLSKKTAQLKEGIIKHIDTQKGMSGMVGYSDSKLLVLLFQLELAKHYKADKVIINNFCPGMVDTGMTDVLPIYLRLPVVAVKKMRARTPEKGTWIALHAALVAGKETHGRLLADKDIEELSGFIKSSEGKKIQEMLWNETVDEMEGLVTIPSWMSKLS